MSDDGEDHRRARNGRGDRAGDRVGGGPLTNEQGEVEMVTVEDVDFEGAKDKVTAITPVPGGVGPVTVAMLLRNTITCAKLQR